MSRSLQLVRFECLMKVMWQYQVRFFFLWSAYVRKNNLWKDKRRQCWSRPSDKRGTWSPKKIFFSPFGPQFGLKIRGGGGRGGGSPGPLPWIRHWANSIKNLTGHFVHTEPFNTFAGYTELTNLLTNSRSRLCPIRDFKQIATATCTTRKSPKWRSAHAWKWPFALAPNPTIGSLRCHYGDGNENVKKAIGFG